MEELLDAVTGGAIWGAGFAVAMGAVQLAGTALRPAAKGTVRGAMSVGDWLRGAAGSAGAAVQDVYREAKAEREGQA